METTHNSMTTRRILASNQHKPVSCEPRTVLLKASVIISAIASSLAVLLVSAWIMSQGRMDVVSIGSWMSGLVLMALAVDEPGWRTVPLWITGAAQLILAWLCFNVAAEFGLFSALVLAAWSAIAIMSRPAKDQNEGVFQTGR